MIGSWPRVWPITLPRRSSSIDPSPAASWSTTAAEALCACDAHGDTRIISGVECSLARFRGSRQISGFDGSESPQIFENTIVTRDLVVPSRVEILGAPLNHMQIKSLRFLWLVENRQFSRSLRPSRRHPRKGADKSFDISGLQRARCDREWPFKALRLLDSTVAILAAFQVRSRMAVQGIATFCVDTGAR